VTINSAELRAINKEMDDLLGHPAAMKLRLWEITGRLAAFDKDLIARR
jgi:hypothetical protein